MTVYVLDFDNVVVRGSEEMKAHAWREVLAPYGSPALPLLAEAERLYGRGKGGDRFDILRHVFSGLGTSGEALASSVAAASARFDDIVQAYIRTTGIDSTDREAIKVLARRRAVYVNSATPREALTHAVHSIAPGLFTGIFGRPASKIENLREIAAQEHVSPQEVLFVGDSDADWNAAEEFGCRFLGLSTPENGWTEKEKPFRIIGHLREVQE